MAAFLNLILAVVWARPVDGKKVHITNGVSRAVAMEIKLHPDLYSAYEEIKKFYIDNDALPNSRTLSRLMNIPRALASQYLSELTDKKVITRNSQSGYMWVRSRRIKPRD